VSRTGLSKKLRFEIFKRDEFTCSYCGEKPPRVVLEVDHIVPVVEGGTDEKSNLTTACFDCNRGKGPIPLGQLPQAVNDRRDLMMEREEQERAYVKFIKARRKRQDALIDEIGAALFGDGYTFKPAGANSCRSFLEKLPFDQVLFAAERASTAGRTPFKYFCGCCWNLIRKAEAR
jgi:hypothetical protein